MEDRVITPKAAAACHRALSTIVDKIEALQEPDAWDKEILEIANDALDEHPLRVRKPASPCPRRN